MKKKAKTTKKAATSKKKVAKKAPAKKAAPAKPATKKTAAKKVTKKTTKKAAAAKTAKTTKKAGASKKAGAKAAAPGSKKTSKAAAAKGKKTSKKKAGAGGASGSNDRYRSMYGGTADKGAQAAASLLKAMGIDRPASSGPALVDGDGDAARLTKSPLKKAQLRKFDEILRLKRAEIAGDVTTMESEALNTGGDRASSALSQHMADQGSDAYEQSLALDLVASQRDLIKEIDAALARISAGTFGICEVTGRAINLERLENTPWARLSIDAARAAERMSFRR